jgi:hypothetical protein
VAAPRFCARGDDEVNLLSELKGLIAAAAVLTAVPLLLASALHLPDRLSGRDLGSALHYFSSVSL